MRRVLVVGNGGAGKSTMSAAIASRTGLPHVFLDSLYWKENWEASPSDEWEKTVRATIERDAWVLDGNYRGTLTIRLAACDTVVFMDTPRLVCLSRLLRRRIRYHGQVRPELSPGCKEELHSDFLRWVWRYPKHVRPELLRTLDAAKKDKNVVILRTEQERRSFLDSLPGQPDASKEKSG